MFHSPPSVIEVEHSPPLESVPTSTVSVHSPPNNNDGNRSSFEGEDLDQEKASKGENVGKSKASKPRHQILIKDWPDNVPFDEMKTVATIGNFDYLVLNTLKLKILSKHYFISPFTAYANCLMLIIYLCFSC